MGIAIENHPCACCNLSPLNNNSNYGASVIKIDFSPLQKSSAEKDEPSVIISWKEFCESVVFSGHVLLATRLLQCFYVFAAADGETNGN